MAQMERLFAVDLDQRALPGPVARVLEDVAKEHEARAIVERVGDNHLVPGVEGHVEGVGVAELVRFAFVDQRVGVDTEVAEHSVGDVGVPELILDDPHHRDVVLHSWRALSSAEV